ncbi:glycosyltransferase family 1 protein [Virgibacillus sp. AGTR]|uniref:glycosyltransferase family 1 protein n=1 Tax=unclassified Virgibacillus TaxID=2620237 RepID=UPI000EF49AEA|nr:MULTISPECIES: glycosyltransferase family 1 protein [unclassified Virgibacillus]MCC2251528.1 glycosyltransferase family 1 protein [Virgibacillus sp. AGTR]MDY7044724.1 glycosyltransferase family 1 protein [Virgibacillus sp. M23]QRZ18961.1 glycosyltransferase family 1 protein [Virgibacillus sp. AGTR]
MKQKKPIRVLHVVGAMNRGGTETLLMNIYRRLNHQQIQFDFISYSSEEADYDQEIRSLGGSVITLTKTNSIREIYHAIKHYGPYVAIHAHTLFHCGVAMTAGYLAGVKRRISHAHTTKDEGNSIIRKAYKPTMRLLIQLFSTHLLACSNHAGHYLFGRRGLSKQTYAYFPNAIEYTHFLYKDHKQVEQFKREEGLSNQRIIGHIGRFIAAKNHRFLLEILKVCRQKDPTVMLILVGEGKLQKELQETAKQEKLDQNIRFLGLRKDIPTILHTMDVFLFPSIYEGLGLVLLEAQASGLPCIVSEAIQPEADLKLGLISRISLQEGPQYWADKIMNMVYKREKNTMKVKAAFEKNGYSVSLAIAKLMGIYISDSGGVYEEKNIYRLL